MPSRIVRDFTDSKDVDNAGEPGENLFLRLLVKADDFGRFTADPQLLKSLCYPLRDDLRSTDMSRRLVSIQEAGLVRSYAVDQTGVSRWLSADELAGACALGHKWFLVIPKFGQQIRAKSSKYPAPPHDNCLATAQQMHGNHLSNAHKMDEPGNSRQVHLQQEIIGGNAENAKQTLSNCSADAEHLRTYSVFRISNSDIRIPTAAAADAAQMLSMVTAEEDELDREIKKYISEHSRLAPWDRKTHAKCRELTIAVGWDRARELIEEGIASAVSFPIGWALGAAKNASEALGKTGKKTRRSRREEESDAIVDAAAEELKAEFAEQERKVRK